jgi:hypothetical protein
VNAGKHKTVSNDRMGVTGQGLNQQIAARLQLGKENSLLHWLQRGAGRTYSQTRFGVEG